MGTDGTHRVVVVGGGFAGLQAIKALRDAPVEVTLIDRNNYHLFQPLSYQVATGALSPAEIAEPLRKIFRRDPKVRVMLAEVTGVDLDQRHVVVQPRAGQAGPVTVPYDSLVVAGGSAYSYFGHEEWRPIALEVKSLDSAIHVRGRILRAFEAAELESDPKARAAWLTFVVVGAGPTGVEMAGQIAELARDALPEDFRAMDTRAGRVLLVEMADRVLPSFVPSLSARAERSLRGLGVTPLTGHTVVGMSEEAVEVQRAGGAAETLPARTVIWAAGVTASPLAKMLADASGADVDRAGRIAVGTDLSLPGHPEVLALGDMARPNGEVLPGVAPPAMQEGRYAGRLIRDRLAGRSTPPFRYRDKGDLATIGRAQAVADLRVARVGGFVAWLLWLGVHLFYLIGFENRVLVMVRWAVAFFTRNRGARLITDT